MVTYLPVPKDPVKNQSAEDAASNEAQDRRIIWAFLWTLFGFKIATVLVIIWIAGGSKETDAILSATTWPFLLLPVVAIASACGYHYRVRRVRAKREQLIRSEWMID